MQPEKLDKLIKFEYLIGSRTGDLVAYNIIPQPLRYRHQQFNAKTYICNITFFPIPSFM
jgi:hypothetical protein